MDMTSELTRVGVSAASASVKGVIVTDNTAAWAKGSPNKIRSSYYTLQVTSGSVTAVNHGLKVDYNPIRIPAVEVFACSGDGIDCAALAVQSGGSGQATFSLDGNSYLLTTMGPPCEVGISCSFYLASWHLMNMVREMNGSNPIGFPQIAAIVDSPNSVYILDLERKSIWFTVIKGSLPTSGSIGDLIDVQSDGAGSVVLNFAANRVLLDFVRDRAMHATAEGLLSSDSALVGMGSSGFTAAVTVPRAGDQSPKLLHLSSTACVWSSHYLVAPSVFQVGQIALREAEKTLIAAEGSAAFFSAFSADNTVGQKWHVVNGMLVANAASFPISGPASGYQLVRGDLWKTGTESASLVNAANGLSSPTSIDSAVVISLAAGQAVLKRQVGSNCRYVHLLQNETSSAAFKDSGLVMSCNTYAGITRSGNSMSIFGQSGSLVQVGFIAK